MSIYTELCSAMNDAQTQNENFRRMAQRMAVSFSDALRNYIDAPKSWVREIDEHKTEEPYVFVVPIDENDVEYKVGTPPLASMSFTQDNFYRFKLVLVLEHSLKSYPKNLHMIPCGVRPEKDGSCMVFVELPGIPQHRVFHCPALNISKNDETSLCDFDAPVKYSIELVKAWFSYDPFSTKI